jgi:damage-control phosphatase, subfamily I
MKAVPYCIPDILETIFATARQVSEDQFIHAKVLDKVMTYLVARDDFGNLPQALEFDCLQVACKALGVRDPFEKEKARLNRSMLGLKDRLLSMEEKAPDRLLSCLRFSLAAADENPKILSRADFEEDIRDNLRNVPAIDQSPELEKRLASASRVMLICNAAGEILVDALLAQHMARTAQVTVVVAAQPVLNRALREDAQQAGIPAFAQVIDPGAGLLGIALKKSSTEFQEEFAAAEVIIAKGQDNYQTLAGADKDIFHILRCSCPEVAKKLGVPVGSGVISLATE